MENLGEALKMGFAIAFFVMALSLSMSSFSQANRAIDAVITARDRDTQLEYALLEDVEEQYVYVEPVSSENLTRTVGIETVVSTINRAINENIEIHFFEENGTTSFKLYEDVESGELISCIDPIRLYNDEDLGTTQQVKAFIKLLLGGKSVSDEPGNCGIDIGTGKEWENDTEWENFVDKHQNKFSSYWNSGGLFEELKDYEFEEKFGEYYQGSGATEIKKVVITYVLKHP